MVTVEGLVKTITCCTGEFQLLLQPILVESSLLYTVFCSYSLWREIMADALTAAGTAMFDDVMMAKILVLGLRGRFGDDLLRSGFHLRVRTMSKRVLATSGKQGTNHVEYIIVCLSAYHLNWFNALLFWPSISELAAGRSAGNYPVLSCNASTSASLLERQPRRRIRRSLRMPFSNGLGNLVPLHLGFRYFGSTWYDQ